MAMSLSLWIRITFAISNSVSHSWSPIVVTFLHKRVFRPKALVVSWHKPREKKALEHTANGRVLWLDAITHEGERISIINIHQATARRPDLQRRVNTHIQAEMNKSEGRRRIMGGDLNAATSRTGYSISTKSHFEISF